jgi:hypothetical protein
MLMMRKVILTPWQTISRMRKLFDMGEERNDPHGKQFRECVSCLIWGKNVMIPMANNFANA